MFVHIISSASTLFCCTLWVNRSHLISFGLHVSCNFRLHSTTFIYMIIEVDSEFIAVHAHSSQRKVIYVGSQTIRLSANASLNMTLIGVVTSRRRKKHTHTSSHNYTADRFHNRFCMVKLIGWCVTKESSLQGKRALKSEIKTIEIAFQISLLCCKFMLRFVWENLNGWVDIVQVSHHKIRTIAKAIHNDNIEKSQ